MMDEARTQTLLNVLSVVLLAMLVFDFAYVIFTALSTL
jgi:hypothetical protein